MICRGTDISKYFRESLGIRDNESRLYWLLLRLTSFYSVSRQSVGETTINIVGRMRNLLAFTSLEASIFVCSDSLSLQ